EDRRFRRAEPRRRSRRPRPSCRTDGLACPPRSGSIRARLDDEGLSGDDRQSFGSEADGERAQVPALESPVTARRKLRAGPDRDDLRTRPGVRARLRPDLDGLSERERGEPLLRHLDPQARRLELQRDDRLSDTDPLPHPVMARENAPSGRRDERALLLEVPDLSETRVERLLLRRQLSLLRLA